MGPLVPSYQFPSLQQITVYLWVDVFKASYHLAEAVILSPEEKKKDMSQCAFPPCNEHKNIHYIEPAMSKLLLHISRTCLCQEEDNTELQTP